MHTGNNATHAINTVLKGMADRIPDADGGVIAITKNGDVGYAWNSEQMAWAYTKGVDIHYGVERGEELIEPLDNHVTSSSGPTSSSPSPTTNTPTTEGSGLANPNNTNLPPLIILILLSIMTLMISRFYQTL